MKFLKMRLNKGIVKEESGQTLVLVLLMLIIGAIVAFAIAARTIQDIQRTGREKASAKAAAQAESFLDVVTSSEVWPEIVDDAGFTGFCQGTPENGVCPISHTDLSGPPFLLDLECDEAEVQVRLAADLEGVDVNKDTSYEVFLGSETGNFQVRWEGAATYLLAKVYSVDEVEEYAFNHGGTWGVSLAEESFSDPIPYSEEQEILRIKPVGGNATIWVTGVPRQEALIKGSCYVGDVYREFVRRIPLHESLPSCFDYVLFDGSTRVEDFGN